MTKQRRNVLLVLLAMLVFAVVNLLSASREASVAIPYSHSSSSWSRGR